MTPTRFFLEYMDTVCSFLPSIYHARALSERCWLELHRHHRLLQALPRLKAINIKAVSEGVDLISVARTADKQDKEQATWRTVGRFISSWGSACKGIASSDSSDRLVWTDHWRRIAARLRLLLSSLGALFTLAVGIALQQRHGIGECAALHDQHSCESLPRQHSLFDEARRVCVWELQEPAVSILRPTALQPYVEVFACEARPARELLTTFSLCAVCSIALLMSVLADIAAEHLLRIVSSFLLLAMADGQHYRLSRHLQELQGRLLPIELQAQLQRLEKFAATHLLR